MPDRPGGGERLRGMKILVIEDSVAVRSLLAMLLRLEGAEVAEAADGNVACELVRQKEFDVAVSDLGLPDVPGEALIPHIHAVSRGRTRVAIFTGAAEPRLARARAAGADRVLTKPLEWDDLVQYLHHRHRRRAPAAA